MIHISVFTGESLRLHAQYKIEYNDFHMQESQPTFPVESSITRKMIFDALVNDIDDYREFARRFAWRLSTSSGIGTQDIGDEVIQDLGLKLSNPQYAPPTGIDSPKAYLKTAIRNGVIDYIRHQQRELQEDRIDRRFELDNHHKKVASEGISSGSRWLSRGKMNLQDIHTDFTQYERREAARLARKFLDFATKGGEFERKHFKKPISMPKANFPRGLKVLELYSEGLSAMEMNDVLVEMGYLDPIDKTSPQEYNRRKDLINQISHRMIEAVKAAVINIDRSIIDAMMEEHEEIE